jgi:hypothetical protein
MRLVEQQPEWRSQRQCQAEHEQQPRHGHSRWHDRVDRSVGVQLGFVRAVADRERAL